MNGEETALDWGEVAKRLIALRTVYEGAEHGAQKRFAERLGIPAQRWNNVEKGSPVHRDLAVYLVQRFPGLTLDWIYFGRSPGLTLEMAEALGINDLPNKRAN